MALATSLLTAASASSQTAPPAPTPASQTPATASPPAPSPWYQRLALRGYTQFRIGRARTGDGVALEMPADRTVNANETFLIRRGRFILSGDVSPRVALYAQADFNASPGTGDYALQMRDLYVDVSLDARQTWRIRLGQSKVPFGWVNMQSSQNRLPLERPDAINSAAETERDLGAYLMWATPTARQRFRDLVRLGLKGSGDYGVVAIGGYSGQGPNRSDQNGALHALARVSYPFRLRSGQFVEAGVQAYRGRFVPGTQAVPTAAGSVTPVPAEGGVLDTRLAATFVWYPQPIGVEAEWNVGRGPMLDDDARRISAHALRGGYVQVAVRHTRGSLVVIPFTRWQHYDGGRKFARNAPHARVHDLETGVELAPWPDLEVTLVYTKVFERMRTSAPPYLPARQAHRVGLQVQWNY